MMGDHKDKDPLGVVAKLVQAAIAKKHRKSSAVIGACNQLLARVMAVDLPDDPFLNADVRVIQPDTEPTEYDRFWLSVGTLCCASFTDALAAFADQRCCPRDIQPLETRYVLSTLMWRANSHLCSAAQITRAFFGNLKGLFVTCDGKRFSPTVSCMVPKLQQQQQQEQLEEQEPHDLQAVLSNGGTNTPREKRAARWRNTKNSKLNNKNTNGNKNTQCFSKLPVVVRVTEDSVNLPRNNLFLTHGQLLVCTWTQTTTASQNNQCSANQEKIEEEEVNNVRGVCLVKQNVGGACAQSIVFCCTTTATTTTTSHKSHNSSNNSNQATSDTEQENKDDTDDVCVRTTSDFKHTVVNHRQACGTDAYAVVFAPGNIQDNDKSSNQGNNQGSSCSSLGTEKSIVDMSQSVVLCFRFASIEACGEASGVLVRNTFGPHLFIALCDLDASIVSKASTHSRVCGEFCSSVVSDYAGSACGAQVHLPHDVSFVVSQRNFAIAAWPQKLGLIERHVVANAVRWQFVSVFAGAAYRCATTVQRATNAATNAATV